MIITPYNVVTRGYEADYINGYNWAYMLVQRDRPTIEELEIEYHSASAYFGMDPANDSYVIGALEALEYFIAMKKLEAY